MKKLLLTALSCSLLAASTAAAQETAPSCPTSTAPFPPSAAGERHPETVSVVTGDSPEYAFADASGYVHAPLANVLKALKDAKVVIDRRRVDTWSFPPTKDTSGFIVHNVVRGAAVVEFDMTWRRSILEGTDEAPLLVCAQASKTAGSQYIYTLKQSVLAKAIDSHTTSVQIVSRLKAESAGKDDAEQYVRDIYANIVAKAHGRLLPEFKKP